MALAFCVGNPAGRSILHLKHGDLKFISGLCKLAGLIRVIGRIEIGGLYRQIGAPDYPAVLPLAGNCGRDQRTAAGIVAAPGGLKSDGIFPLTGSGDLADGDAASVLLKHHLSLQVLRGIGGNTQGQGGCG